MNQPPSSNFLYEQCDVPEGQTLTEWRTRHAPPSRRRAQLSGGMLAAVATLVPIVLSVRGVRHSR
jgi:hypothetical protein